MKITQLLTLSALAAAAAFAQVTATGTITITGSVPASISMTNDAAPSNTLLNGTIALGSLVAANTATLATLTNPVNVRIRSNKQFKLSAMVAPMTFTSTDLDDSGLPITAADIGFGITATLQPLNSTGRPADSIDPLFDCSTGFGTVANGHMTFTKATLNDLLTSKDILTGHRISKSGNQQSDDNFLTVSFNAATLPQYFTPNTGFSAMVTLTAAIN